MTAHAVVALVPRRCAVAQPNAPQAVKLVSCLLALLIAPPFFFIFFFIYNIYQDISLVNLWSIFGQSLVNLWSILKDLILKIKISQNWK